MWPVVLVVMYIIALILFLWGWVRLINFINTDEPVDNDFDGSTLDPRWNWSTKSDEKYINKNYMFEDDYIIGDDNPDWGDKS